MGIFHSLIELLGLALLFSLTFPWLTRLDGRRRDLAFGIGLGVVAAGAMLARFTIIDGIVRDARNVAVAAAGAFAGPIGATAAAVTAVAARIAVGGSVVGAALGIVAAGVTGVLFARACGGRPPWHWSRHLLLGVVLALVNSAMPLAFPWLLDGLEASPAAIAGVIFLGTAVSYPPAMLVLGGFIARELRRRADAEALARSHDEVQGYRDRLEEMVDERTRALAESEDRYRSLVELSPDAILVTVNCVVRFANGAAARLLGAEASGDVSGRRFLDWVPPAEREELDLWLRRVRAGVVPEESDYREVTLLRADGTPFAAEISARRTTYMGELAVQVVVRDVTERMQYAQALTEKSEALERSNRDLEQFAYAVSHDLQEPLRNVTTFLDLLVRRHSDKLESAAREYIDIAADAGRRMSRQIRDLLEFSRISTRARPPEAVAAAEALEVALKNLRPKIEEAGARVEIEAPLPRVMADRSQLVSLFQNLLGNAIKYRHPDRTPMVRVTAREDPQGPAIAISDNGIGIDPGFFERIFGVFQRLHADAAFPGTGVGLAVCKRIVERHGGRIWVESTPGAGTTFTFVLPSADAETLPTGK